MISETNCPIAVEPAPPAVTVRTFAEVTVPAREPAVPAVYEVCPVRLPTVPTVGAAVGIASAWV